MTTPSEQTIEREQGKLYLSDAELIRRLGVPENIFVKPDLSRNA